MAYEKLCASNFLNDKVNITPVPALTNNKFPHQIKAVYRCLKTAIDFMGKAGHWPNFWLKNHAKVDLKGSK